jgi:hypothetical protein
MRLYNEGQDSHLRGLRQGFLLFFWSSSRRIHDQPKLMVGIRFAVRAALRMRRPNSIAFGLRMKVLVVIEPLVLFLTKIYVDLFNLLHYTMLGWRECLPILLARLEQRRARQLF